MSDGITVPAEKRRRPVVVGIEESADGRAAVRLAFDEAAVRGTGVVLVRTWRHEFVAAERPAPAGALAAVLLEREASAVVDRVVGDGADLAPVPWVDRIVAEGPAGAVLASESRSADLLVVGSRGYTGATALACGSVSLHCALHAGCPVAVVPPASRAGCDGDRPPAVVVGVDGSVGSRAALAWAVDEALLRQRRLRAVTVWCPPRVVTATRTVVLPDRRVRAEAVEVLDAAVDAALVGAAALEVERLVVCGSPFTTLVACAGGRDLLVLGSRGYGGFAGLLLGSVVQHALGRAHCPVVVVHGRR